MRRASELDIIDAAADPALGRCTDADCWTQSA
jgi:hypothetical protein